MMFVVNHYHNDIHTVMFCVGETQYPNQMHSHNYAHLCLPCPIAVLQRFNFEAGILIESGMDSAISTSSDSVGQ